MKRIIIILLLLSFVLFVSGCVSYEAHFCPDEDCGQIMINFFNDSENISCAFYDIDLEDVINFLKEKNATVIVYEKNPVEGFASIKSRGLMHNKFCVSENKVITGSFNPTERGNFYNNNNILLISSKKIANEYRNYFFYLRDRREEGVKYKEKKSNIYFCPMDGCKDIIVKEIDKAKKSIYFMTFSFTSREIANSILIKYYENLSVKGIYEKQQDSKYSTYWLLKYHGAEVREDGNDYKMHHKVIIIDNRTLITGSFNPSSNADKRNDENLVVLKDKDVVKAYAGEFEKLYKSSQPN